MVDCDGCLSMCNACWSGLECAESESHPGRQVSSHAQLSGKGTVERMQEICSLTQYALMQEVCSLTCHSDNSFLFLQYPYASII